MKLYIIRHGETDWNKTKRLQGKTDIPLNAFGKELARKTAEGLQDVSFDLVITSPLKRARETAIIIKNNREIPMIEDARIEEMSFGQYEGMCCKGEGFNIPDEEFHYFFDEPESYRPTGEGESFPEFCSRVENFLDDLLTNHEYQNDTILLVVHGAVLCAMLRKMKNRSLREFWGNGVHKNCGVTIVEVKNGVIDIKEENKTYYDDETEDW